ncbi:FAD-dependent monooxygenase [Nonomuraea sp. NPDC050310]|uniref:FAD-dependent monooxygenase n=1 Tax=Nonomuraea sp. NPDC050310 TaxID=3154935 RepID=UPI0033E524A0
MTLTNTTVLISGASIAGPALAFWLARAGAKVTLVEKAPALRPGGQAVDFKGETHLTVLERMGVLERIREHQTGGTDLTIIDEKGREVAVWPGEFTGGDLEILRGDLARILVEQTEKSCEYVFGDSITSLTETPAGVHVSFERGAPRTFDLVIGADGIHSNVRRLAFGPEHEHVRHLGYYYALADLDLDVEPVMYNEPGRMISLGGSKAASFFVFASPELFYDRYDEEQQKELVRAAFAGCGWRVPEVLAALDRAGSVYLDSISQARVDSYAAGRVALIGDAAYGNTLGGFGTGLAVVAAYVLAGELATNADHRTAFRRYEELFRPYAKSAENGNAGPFMAPKTRPGRWLRNQLFRRRFLLTSMIKMGDRMASRIDLPDYTCLRWPASTTKSAPVVAAERGDTSSVITSATS